MRRDVEQLVQWCLQWREEERREREAQLKAKWRAQDAQKQQEATSVTVATWDGKEWQWVS